MAIILKTLDFILSWPRSFFRSGRSSPSLLPHKRKRGWGARSPSAAPTLCFYGSNCFFSNLLIFSLKIPLCVEIRIIITNKFKNNIKGTSKNLIKYTSQKISEWVYFLVLEWVARASFITGRSSQSIEIAILWTSKGHIIET